MHGGDTDAPGGDWSWVLCRFDQSPEFPPTADREVLSLMEVESAREGRQRRCRHFKAPPALAAAMVPGRRQQSAANAQAPMGWAHVELGDDAEGALGIERKFLAQCQESHRLTVGARAVGEEDDAATVLKGYLKLRLTG
jgi:hypothetical protein